MVAQFLSEFNSQALPVAIAEVVFLYTTVLKKRRPVPTQIGNKKIGAFVRGIHRRVFCT